MLLADPGVLQRLRRGQPPLRVHAQQPADQVASCEGEKGRKLKHMGACVLVASITEHLKTWCFRTIEIGNSRGPYGKRPLFLRDEQPYEERESCIRLNIRGTNSEVVMDKSTRKSSHSISNVKIESIPFDDLKFDWKMDFLVMNCN